MSNLIRLSKLQKIGLGVASGIQAVRDPWRSDLVAVSGEVLLPEGALKRLANSMNSHGEVAKT